MNNDTAARAAITEPNWPKENEMLFFGNIISELQGIVDGIGTGAGNEAIIKLGFDCHVTDQDPPEELAGRDDETGLIIRSGQTIKFTVLTDVREITPHVIDGDNLIRVITIESGATVFLEDIIIRNGVADNGGGVYNSGTLVLLEKSAVQDCTAVENGGGVYNAQGAVFYGASGSMTDNIAGGSGGAIYTPRSNLANIKVDSGFIFGGNTAQYGVNLTDSAGIALHEANIKATKFTAPFTYGYNNYDISYPFYAQVQARKRGVNKALADSQFEFGLFQEEETES